MSAIDDEFPELSDLGKEAVLISRSKDLANHPERLERLHELRELAGIGSKEATFIAFMIEAFIVARSSESF